MQNLLNAFRRSKPAALLIIVVAVAMTGCSSLRFPGVFRIDVGQGNLITKEMLDKLRVGMTPRQVEYVMGSPMIADTFHPNRWDYMYSLETGKGILVQNQLTLFFENERLAKIDTSRYKDPEALRNDLLKQMGIELPTQPTPAGEPENAPQKETTEPAPSTET
ncbi:outer membrane protein assembly factor BamE [Ketobacter sp.]|uniref:outer membrane protein assembly factor BamE n=1 Tax=Ketobacter sp. TaxID=2083498 RepID=UPI0025BD4D91|nr:outer membrane protein assembly factor BamE [Ketobacter sp.]